MMSYVSLTTWRLTRFSLSCYNRLCHFRLILCQPFLFYCDIIHILISWFSILRLLTSILRRLTDISLMWVCLYRCMLLKRLILVFSYSRVFQIFRYVLLMPGLCLINIICWKSWFYMIKSGRFFFVPPL